MAIRSDAIKNSTQNPSMSGRGAAPGRGLIRGANGNAFMVSEGQTLKGVVTDIHGNQITIQLDDGNSFTGQLADASNYSIGQGAAFQVTSTNNGVIYMQAATDAYLLSAEDTVFQALEEAGLPKSPRNVEIVKSLLNNQQSISRQNIQDTIRMLAGFPDNSIDSVITAKHIGLPMTKESISQFEQYTKGTHQLQSKMDTLTENINQMLSTVGEKAPNIAGTIATRMINLALEPSEFLEDPTISSQPTEDLEPSEFLENPTLSSQPTEGLPVDEEGNIQYPVIPEAEAETTPENITYDRGQLGFTLTEEARENLTNLIKDFPLPDETKLSILDGTLDNKEFLSQIKSILTSLPSDQAASLVRDASFQSILKDALVSGWSISPRAFADPDNIEKLYEKLDRQLSALTKLSQSVSSQQTFLELGKSAGDMKDNLNFMKTLNQSFTYMQLPLKLQEENAHGDLYVMTKKGELKQHPDKLSVLIHLEMDRLKELDIHIKKENTHVETKFFVQDTKSRALLEKNIELLQDALNEQGFSFSSSFENKKKEVDLVKDFVAADKPIGDMKRYSFDLRA